MELEWADIAIPILWLLMLAFVVGMVWFILFIDSLAGEEGGYLDKHSFLSRLGMFILYASALGLPAVMLVAFVPVMSASKRLGLTAQDIDLARQYPDLRERFGGIERYLHRMDQALDDPEAAVWKETKRFVIAQFGGHPFPRDPWQALIDWGRQIERERGASNATVPETRAIRAAIARLHGSDDLPERIAKLRQQCGENPKIRDSRDPSVVDTYVRYAMTLHVFYPNDDIAYLAFANGFRKLPRTDSAESGTGFIILLFMGAIIFLFGLLVQRGMRLLSVRLLGKILVLKSDPVFEHFHREAFNPYRFLLSFAIVFPMTALFAWLTVEPYYVLVYRQPWSYFLAVAWNVMMGGVLVETLGNILSLFLIRWNYDPLRMILDNIIVIAVSIPLLLYFNNSWFSIVGGITLGLLQSLFEKFTFWYTAGKHRRATLAALDQKTA